MKFVENYVYGIYDRCRLPSTYIIINGISNVINSMFV